jgi:hypothetical protein
MLGQKLLVSKVNTCVWGDIGVLEHEQIPLLADRFGASRNSGETDSRIQRRAGVL